MSFVPAPIPGPKDYDLLSSASRNQVVTWAWRLTLKRLVWCSALAAKGLQRIAMDWICFLKVCTRRPRHFGTKRCAIILTESLLWHFRKMIINKCNLKGNLTSSNQRKFKQSLGNMFWWVDENQTAQNSTSFNLEIYARCKHRHESGWFESVEWLEHLQRL